MASDPALPSLAPHQLQHLIQTPAALGGNSRRGPPPRLTFAQQVRATVLHLRVDAAT